MKNIHHHYVVTSLLFGLFILGASGGVYGVVSALQTQEMPSEPETLRDLKTQDSVVVVTSEPSELIRAAEKEDLEVIDDVSLSKARSYVTIEGSTSDTDIKQLAEDKDSIIIGKIAPNLRYKLAVTPNDTYYSQQWNLPRISAPSAWDVPTSGTPVSIAVLDTGVLSSQQWSGRGPYNQADFPSSKIWNNQGEVGTTALEGAAPNCTSRSLALDKKCNNRDDDSNGFVDDWRGWDFMGGWRGGGATCPNYADTTTYANGGDPDYIAQDNDPQPYSCDDVANPNQVNKDHYNGGCGYGVGACAIGHGTNVASVAASASNNATAISGVDWNASIMNLRVMDGYGYGSSSQIAAAIDYAIRMDTDVINMSLTLSYGDDCTITDTLIESLLSQAKSAGIVVVAASGNDNIGSVCYPARSPHAIAVGASDRNDVRSSFSNYGPELDVMAPGSDVPAANAPSAARTSSYSPSVYGTSFASPHVAGLAAMVKSVQPSLSAQDIRDAITSSADKVSSMNGQLFTNGYGYGRINASRALQVEPPPTYISLSKSKEMATTITTQKTNLRTGIDAGAMFAKGHVFKFVSKAYINGKWYFRTAHDATYGYHRAIDSANVKDVPRYVRLDHPREMRLRVPGYKTNLLTSLKTGSKLSKGHVLRFETKVYLNGKWYFRTANDTKYRYHRVIPRSLLIEK